MRIESKYDSGCVMVLGITGDSDAEEVHRRDWLTLGVDGGVGYGVCRVHAAAIDYFSKYSILTVERVVVGEVDVELGTSAIRVRGTCHSKIANVVV